MWKCSECGTETEGNFCGKCGSSRMENDTLHSSSEDEKHQQEMPVNDDQKPIPEEKDGRKGCIIAAIVIVVIIALLSTVVYFAVSLIFSAVTVYTEESVTEIEIYVDEEVFVEEEALEGAIENFEWPSPFNFDVWDSPEVVQIKRDGIVLDVPVPPNTVVNEEERDHIVLFLQEDTSDDWLRVELILRNRMENDFEEYFAAEWEDNWEFHNSWAEVLDVQKVEERNVGIMITHWDTGCSDYGKGFSFTKISQYQEAVLLTEIRFLTAEGREELFEAYGFMDAFGEIIESVLDDILSGEADITQEQIGFDSPEEAVIAFLEGVRDQDLDRMTEAVFDDSHDGVHAMEVSFHYVFFLYFFLTEDFLNDDFQIEDLQIGDFPLLTDTGQSEFQSLEIVGFIPPEAFTELYLSETNQTNLSNRAERLGVDQLVSCVVLFELDGEKYMTFLDVAGVDGRWYISQFNGNIGMLLYLSHMMQGIIPPEFSDEFIGEIDLEEWMIPIDELVH